jgi:hypothetical protein
LKDPVFGQAKINENLTKKLSYNDKMLENINTKINDLSTSIQNQLSFNKMIETKLAQITASIPVNNEGKILGQPENSFEKVNVVTMKGGKSTRDPLNPNNKIGEAQGQQEERPLPTMKTQKYHEEVEETAPEDFIDTTYLPFPIRKRKQAMDEQFAHFVEMIEKIHVSIPLMDVLHVPSYAKYIKDIINNKRPLLSMKVIKLTKECSAAILNRLPDKKKDPGCPHNHVFYRHPTV